MLFKNIKEKLNFSIASVRGPAFVTFCAISIAINLNMFINLVPSFWEKAVLALVSFATEGAKIYYIKSAPLYFQKGRKRKARLFYCLYAVCALLAVIAAFGYIKTTILSADTVASVQSSTEEVSNLKDDITTAEDQIKNLKENRKSDRTNINNDISIIDDQIKTLLVDVKKKKPEDVPENNWNWLIAQKNASIETLKKQKTVLIDKNKQAETDSIAEIKSLEKNKEELLLKKRNLEKTDAKISSEIKTNMFTNIGEPFNIPGKIVMTFILILITILIEVGIVSTVYDPTLETGTTSTPAASSVSAASYPSSIQVIQEKPVTKIRPVKADSPKEEPSKLYVKETPVVKSPKKEVATPVFKPLVVKKQEVATPVVVEEKKQPIEIKPVTDISTIVEKDRVPRQDEAVIKRGITAFLTALYDNKESPDALIDIKKAVRIAGSDYLISKKFFDSVASIKGNKGVSLFVYDKDHDTWYANYSLSYLINDIVPKVHFNFLQTKQSKI